MVTVRLALTSFLLVCAPALAEQRFYQFIDAQGRVQTMLAPESEPATPSIKVPEVSKPKDQPSAAKSVDEAAGEQVEAEKQKGAESAGSQGGVSAGKEVAPQESPDEDDVYIDSEELERKDFNPTGKKRFYLLDDGLGTRVEESDGRLMGMTPGKSMFQADEVSEPRVSLQDKLVETVDTGEIEALLGSKSQCLDRKAMRTADILTNKGVLSAPVDARTPHFLGKHGRLMVARVMGDGLRRLKAVSYSKAQKTPAFFIPIIAFANEQGCVSRLMYSGYFEWQYAATKTRHPRVEGSLIMLSSERYMLVLLPESVPEGEAGVPSAQVGDFIIEYK